MVKYSPGQKVWILSVMHGRIKAIIDGRVPINWTVDGGADQFGSQTPDKVTSWTVVEYGYPSR